MLKEVGLDPASVERERPAADYASIDPIDGPIPDWCAVVAMMVSVDTAVSCALDAFANGSYDAARSRIPKMLAEETFHRDLGLAWFRRLASSSGEATDRLADSLRSMLPRTIAWLDPADEAYGTLVSAGVVVDGALGRWTEQLGAVFEGVGVSLENIGVERDGWDEARGRGPGHPDLESVERARGDKNRSLLVE
jgi:1,2-phenylacetyl-CoA epoxidase catalytic subunit